MRKISLFSSMPKGLNPVVNRLGTLMSWTTIRSTIPKNLDRPCDDLPARTLLVWPCPPYNDSKAMAHIMGGRR